MTSQTPPIPPRASADFSVRDLDPAALNELSESLAYAGFSTKRIRAIAVVNIPAKDLVRILIVAAQVGNAPERLNGKINNPAVGKEMLSLLSRYRIKSAGATGSEDLTLARLSSAFAPLYLKLREAVENTIQDQGLGTGVPRKWQSPSLGLYSDSITGMPEWLKMFGRQIKPTKEAVEISDARTEQFRVIAIANRSRDEYLTIANLGKSITELLTLAYRP